MKCHVILVFGDLPLSDQLEIWLLVHINLLKLQYLTVLIHTLKQNFTFPLGKLRTELTSLIISSNLPTLQDMPLFVNCCDVITLMVVDNFDT